MLRQSQSQTLTRGLWVKDFRVIRVSGSVTCPLQVATGTLEVGSEPAAPAAQAVFRADSAPDAAPEQVLASWAQS